MSAGTNAFGAKAGFNQSGGAYFMTLAALEPSVLNTTDSFIHTLATAGSNSGGAWVAPTLAKASMSSVVGSNTNNASTLVASGKLLRDMGRTVVSAGRTFRKFAPVLPAAAASSFGVTGSAAVSPNSGYASFYLEVGRDGLSPATPAPIARYF